jgi:hypothetical protein
MTINRKCHSSLKVVGLIFLAAVFTIPGAVGADNTTTSDIMTASGHSYTQTIQVSPDDVINNYSNSPASDNWYRFSMPTWYNSNYVTAFTIDMYGYNDNSTNTIDTWRRWTTDGTTDRIVVGFDVDNSTRPFILRTDLVDGSLWYKYSNDNSWPTPTAFTDSNLPLSNIAVANFNGHAHDAFDIGFACHYTLDKLALHIDQRVPEPGTLAFLSLAIIGAAGLKRSAKK